jgi:hypothetical protein
MSNASKKAWVLNDELDAVNGGYGWQSFGRDTTQDYTDLHGMFNGTTGPGETTWPPTAPMQQLPDTTQDYNDMHGIFSPGPREQPLDEPTGDSFDEPIDD